MTQLTGFFTGLAVLITAIGAVIVAVIKVIGTTKKEINSIPKFIKTQNDVDMQIVGRMEQLKELTGADRVQIYDFHNGGHYANGRSALKTSCTFEVTRIGTPAIQSRLQAIPISCIPKFVDTIVKNREFEVKDIEQLKDLDQATYNLKHHMGVKSFFDVTIYNTAGDPIGFLAVQYCKNPHTVDKVEVYKAAAFIEAKLQELQR